jgi:hypothetical protein
MGGRNVSENPPPGGRQRTFEEDQKPTAEEEEHVKHAVRLRRLRDAEGEE